MYYVVERSTAILRPLAPCIDWLKANFPEIKESLELETIQIDCNSYLIPEVAEHEDGINFIDGIYEDLFKLELSSWTTDKAIWPKNLDLLTFQEWFKVEIYPTMIDLAEATGEFNEDDELSEADETLH